MSDNLTDWLRSANPDSECNDIRCEEAADEIDRLRAENARLREALATYADEANWQQTSEANGDPWDGNVRDLWDGEDENGWDIARAALRAIAEGDA